MHATHIYICVVCVCVNEQGDRGMFEGGGLKQYFILPSLHVIMNIEKGTAQEG